MTAYYNEFDPQAAQWLRNLIAAGHIAPGDVDERSIVDVRPSDLRGYTQCHFFAGVGVWSLALRRAGWPDDRPVWTGSCPCQPFSGAGKGAGFADERHLWPAWHHLVRLCRPRHVFGEQVAGKDGLNWLDLVQADLEGEGYACGPVDLCAAGVGAPHIRQRLWFVAERLGDARGPRSQERVGVGRLQREALGALPRQAAIGGSDPGGLADPQLSGSSRHGEYSGSGEAAQGVRCRPSDCSELDGLADADGRDTCSERQQCGGEQRQQPEDGSGLPSRAAGPTNGFWRDVDWLFCRDGKWRPVEPGTFPLAHGVANRVGCLRAYGNAINAEAATVFIESYLDVEAERAGRADLNEDLDELI